MSITSRPEAVLSSERRTNQNSSQLISFPSNLGPHTMLMVFKEYQYQYARAGEQGLLSLGTGSTIRSQRIASRGGAFLSNYSGIELPIPANLRDNDILRVEGITQSALESAIGGAIAGAASGLSSSDLTLRGMPSAIQGLGRDAANANMGNIYSSGMGALGTAVGDILDQSVGSASRDIMYLLRSVIPAGISQVTDRAAGSTVNPKASLAFEGVELKQHSFNWTLAPKNANDSEKLKALIYKLKQNSLPTYQTLGTDNFNFKAYLKYPSIVDIYLLGVNPDYFVKFKSSMIRSVNVEYGSGGIVSILKGGKPSNVSLNIELLELDIHTAEDYGGSSSVAPLTVGDLTNDIAKPGDLIPPSITTTTLPPAGG